MGLSDGVPGDKNWVLETWPEGYHLYDHHKGKKDAPRHDPYLMGSTNVKRFRSVPEFVPHALWLMTDATLNRANCECKYCTKQPQRIISQNLGFTTRNASPSVSGLLRPRIPREQRSRASRDVARPYAAIRKAPRPVKLPAGPTQVMVYERHNDLQILTAESSLKEYQRWFREEEVIWCALDPPIFGQENITFWPGIVKEITIKPEVLSRASTEVPPQAGIPSVHSADDDADGDPDPDHVDASPLPWTVQQRNVYKVKLLGVSHLYFVEAEFALPYQAYAPSVGLIRAIQNVPIDQMTLDNEKIAAFNPCLDQTPATLEAREERFREAAAPYSLAVEIASGIANFWTPTDEWDYKMTVPPPSPRPLPGATLHSVMSAAEGGPSTSSAPLASGMTGSRDDTSSDELQKVSMRMLAPPPMPTFTQTRFQGLWWGAERIWVDELVRLKAARRQIAPQGAPDIYPPSPPSQETIAQLDPNGEHAPEEYGARNRGVFMKIDGLFIVEIPREDGQGTYNECRASGMLYELADDTWKDPKEKAVQTNGKGKEVETSVPAPDYQGAFAAAGLHPSSLSNPPTTPSRSKDPVELRVGQPFMSAPSPLKPLPLPNPDPAVPLSQTATSVTAAANASAPETSISSPHLTDSTSANASLSRPDPPSGYPLPNAPRGFKFRPILTPGCQVVVTVTLISGRYYPGLFQHPLLAPLARSLKQDPRLCFHDETSHQLLSLEGLNPGYFNAVDPGRWKESRKAMVTEADKEKRADLWEIWMARLREKDAGAMMDMDVDMDEGAVVGAVEEPSPLGLADVDA
ncbi:hypothetical protein EW146_g3760 [Bondarzewia mesenterica]|uniref:Cryptic loci regulator 2 N-terminal domain-containing protein n=1 Tax=Bondarzewia mesenterica TaxID=1095465 RepID=A0A4S4LWT2_9AGAM|nr:hypothetical protein EW146_g3760 [Bondarzewia mesenterica]